ncbi:HipA domain-containing protein [Acuticoccus sp. 2012]|uniref:HipA domain-containing protein n=2 Tax=Acuticoccus mangrovi TaxID=2796142 RepID=A0A934IVL2_9HYPH|nr:HipA domain-containing protein [Acuticoccus mangrovi]MBJ3778554.1 HipA domain-containing protein [Acuticoccus mangrovi]
MPGVYVDASDNADAIVLRYAVRIAKYLYPRAYLSAASAVLLGPTREGKLYICARRNQRTRLRSLEIVQNVAPSRASVTSVSIDDGMGEFRIGVASMRQRFLEAFRLGSEHAASIDDAMRDSMVSRLIEEYGDAQSAADALWALAGENQWRREGELATRHLLHRPAITIAGRSEAAFDLTVAWHGRPVGDLSHDGREWRWTPAADGGPSLIRQTMPGKLPPFILSLLPEGWLESVLKDRDERALLRSGKRYTSNITVVERGRELADLPADVLVTRLADFSDAGVFTGRYAGPGRGEVEAGFERNLAALFARAETPRLAGVQIKAPMSLDADGTLSPSIDKPFTHILKPAGPSGLEALPVVEWQALALGAAAGLAAPATALVPMPDDMPPALLVERFDIRMSGTDTRMLALEDFTSVLGVPTDAKYDGTMERIARALRPLSTVPNDDVLLLLKRALFAWLIADGDMHLKNLALLEVAGAGGDHFAVRMAPLYDAVTTRVFPGLERDRMALKINGKDDRLRRADFRTFAATAGVRASDADAAIDGLLAGLRHGLEKVEVPAALSAGAPTLETIARMRELIAGRLDRFT